MSSTDSAQPPAARTLIVLGSSLTALAVVRVASRCGYSCIMLDTQRGPAATTRRAAFRLIPSDDLDSVRDQLSKLARPQEAALIADSDRWLRFFGKHRDAVAADGWLVLHPGAASINICLDKTAFLAWCAQQGLRAPRVYDAATIESIGADVFPLMVRPEWTQHSGESGLPKAIEVRDRVQLRSLLARYAAKDVRPSICESLLREGLRQFSIGAARDAAGRVCTFLAEKVRPHAHQCAGGTFVRPASHVGVEALAAAALTALDYFGVAEVEILADPGTGAMHLIEINARPWLQYGLPFACGHDLLGHALGGSRQAGRSADLAHAWLSFESDLRTCFSPTDGLVRSGAVGFGEYFRTILSADVHPLWDWRDPAPLLRRLLRLT